MNFVGMPELKSHYGYPVVAIVCGIIILLEFIYFKHKKNVVRSNESPLGR